MSHALRRRLTQSFKRTSSLHNNKQSFQQSLAAAAGTPTQKVFGVRLDPSQKQLPTVLLLIISWFDKHGYDYEGLFRLSGNMASINEVMAKLDAGEELEELESNDANVVAGLLKQYFMLLPEPLLTFELYDCFLAASVVAKQKEELGPIKQALSLLPGSSLRILRALVRLLHQASLRSEVNKMTATNLAIAFSPSIIRPAVEPPLTTMVKDTTRSNSLLETLILHYHDFFEEPSYSPRTRNSSIILHPPSSSTGSHLTPSSFSSSSSSASSSLSLPSPSPSSSSLVRLPFTFSIDESWWPVTDTLRRLLPHPTDYSETKSSSSSSGLGRGQYQGYETAEEGIAAFVEAVKEAGNQNVLESWPSDPVLQAEFLNSLFLLQYYLPVMTPLPASSSSSLSLSPSPLEEVVIPITKLQPYSFFVTPRGGLGLAFSGWPRSMLELKSGVSFLGEVPNSALQIESQGSRWPKILLASLNDNQGLTPRQYSSLLSVCEKANSKLLRRFGELVVDEPQLVLFSSRSLHTSTPASLRLPCQRQPSLSTSASTSSSPSSEEGDPVPSTSSLYVDLVLARQTAPDIFEESVLFAEEPKKASHYAEKRNWRVALVQFLACTPNSKLHFDVLKQFKSMIEEEPTNNPTTPTPTTGTTTRTAVTITIGEETITPAPRPMPITTDAETQEEEGKMVGLGGLFSWMPEDALHITLRKFVPLATPEERKELKLPLAGALAPKEYGDTGLGRLTAEEQCLLLAWLSRMQADQRHRQEQLLHK